MKKSFWDRLKTFLSDPLYEIIFRENDLSGKSQEDKRENEETVTRSIITIRIEFVTACKLYWENRINKLLTIVWLPSLFLFSTYALIVIIPLVFTIFVICRFVFCFEMQKWNRFLRPSVLGPICLAAFFLFYKIAFNSGVHYQYIVQQRDIPELVRFLNSEFNSDATLIEDDERIKRIELVIKIIASDSVSSEAINARRFIGESVYGAHHVSPAYRKTIIKVFAENSITFSDKQQMVNYFLSVSNTSYQEILQNIELCPRDTIAKNIQRFYNGLSLGYESKARIQKIIERILMIRWFSNSALLSYLNDRQMSEMASASAMESSLQSLNNELQTCEDKLYSVNAFLMDARPHLPQKPHPLEYFSFVGEIINRLGFKHFEDESNPFISFDAYTALRYGDQSTSILLTSNTHFNSKGYVQMYVKFREKYVEKDLNNFLVTYNVYQEVAEKDIKRNQSQTEKYPNDLEYYNHWETEVKDPKVLSKFEERKNLTQRIKTLHLQREKQGYKTQLAQKNAIDACNAFVKAL